MPGIANAPYAFGFQYARTHTNYIIGANLGFRGYPRNRLKQKLQANSVYCVKYYVVNTNNNPYAVDGFGAYFANESLDTITQCNVALSYLNPQIKNIEGNIITDTLNWIPISGTFVANGTEKYMVIGNFKTDAATNTLLINPTYSTTITADICMDDVSCIELNLPAFAGRDTVVFAGDSVFLGREPDVGIDEACIWYKLPSTTPIDTVAGFWIKPTEACTYVVRQEICGLVKWDTVRISLFPVGVKGFEVRGLRFGFTVFPNPASGKITIELSDADEKVSSAECKVFDQLGRAVLQKKIVFEGSAELDTRELEEGMYFLELKNELGLVGRKRLFIVR